MKNYEKFGLNLLVLSLLLSAFGCGSNNTEGYYEIHGSTMGTTYSIKMITGDEDSSEILFEGIDEKIDSLLIEVNQQMSTYIENSEITQFNKLSSSEWFDVSSDLAFVFSRAGEISRKSKGAFDITIGPLVNLWGFGPILKVYEVPDPNEIAEIKKIIGYENISVTINPPKLRKKIPEIYCDLSAIAKGFGVDKVSDFIESKNIQNYLVEIGGEVRTKGVNQKGKMWQIGISTPGNEFGIEKVVSLNDAAMATSGDYRNYFEKDSVRYSHTIDSRTGYPITHKLASVTVIHDSCVVADAFATAITVLGPEEGYNLAIRESLPVFLLVREGGSFVGKMTPEFQKILNIN